LRRSSIDLHGQCTTHFGALSDNNSDDFTFVS
jgi:hypothetical protein